MTESMVDAPFVRCQRQCTDGGLPRWHPALEYWSNLAPRRWREVPDCGEPMSTVPILVSFKLCPFVQRSVITLELKRAAYDLRYIDLSDPPDWFLRQSPLRKVPILVAGDEVLFESAVINEYLDETLQPRLLPESPLPRAKQRSWIAFGSELLGNQYLMMTAADEREYEAACSRLRRLEEALGEGPYFAGESLSLVDPAYGPLFMRFALIFQQLERRSCVLRYPKVSAWSEALLALPQVQRSVVPEFPRLLAEWIAKQQGYLAGRFGSEATA